MRAEPPYAQTFRRSHVCVTGFIVVPNFLEWGMEVQS